jgi:hypothetical protein
MGQTQGKERGKFRDGGAQQVRESRGNAAFSSFFSNALFCSLATAPNLCINSLPCPRAAPPAITLAPWDALFNLCLSPLSTFSKRTLVYISYPSLSTLPPHRAPPRSSSSPPSWARPSSTRRKSLWSPSRRGTLSTTRPPQPPPQSSRDSPPGGPRSPNWCVSTHAVACTPEPLNL